MSRTDMLCDAYCIDCQHLCVSAAADETSCNYILDTGHVRGCPPGEGCIRKKPAEPGQQTRHNNLHIGRRYRWVNGLYDPPGGET